MFHFTRVAAIKSAIILACGNSRDHAIGGGSVVVRDVTPLYPIDAHCWLTMRGKPNITSSFTSLYLRGDSSWFLLFSAWMLDLSRVTGSNLPLECYYVPLGINTRHFYEAKILFYLRTSLRGLVSAAVRWGEMKGRECGVIFVYHSATLD